MLLVTERLLLKPQCDKAPSVSDASVIVFDKNYLTVSHDKATGGEAA